MSKDDEAIADKKNSWDCFAPSMLAMTTSSHLSLLRKQESRTEELDSRLRGNDNLHPRTDRVERLTFCSKPL